MMIIGIILNWEDVLCRIPEGFVLGPVLFSTFINDLEGKVNLILIRFTNDKSGK